jgi:small subunit ribosomal protein S19
MAEEIKKKEYLYRGQTIEQLKAFSIRESAKFLPSRSRRTVLRSFDAIERFVKNCEEKVARKKKIKTHLRDTVIVPKLVGYTIGVYTGKEFQEFTITAEMIGHRLGEFALTRAKAVHTTMGMGATKSSRAQKK